MTLEQLFDALNDGDYIYLYDLRENLLYGGCYEKCPEIYFSCWVENIKIGNHCLFITLPIKDGHF